jgi:hypothetical protein
LDEQKIECGMEIAFNSSIDVLNKELEWLNKVISYRFAEYFKHSEQFDYPLAADLSSDESFYATILRKLEIDENSRLLILIALAPHLRPAVFDMFFTKNEQFDRVFAEFGGLKGEKHSGFVPTGETAAFIIAGDNLDRRFKLQRCFNEQHILYRENILTLGFTNAYEPMWGGELIISQEFLTHLTLNEPYNPRFSPNFPAHHLTTKLEWSDAVFDSNVLTEIEHIQSWIKHQKEILDNPNLSKYLKSGYRVLFYGPPGTGKSMTAALLGKSHNMEVYRVDLSSIVSKYIGETEKNLAKLFDIAENKNWILFFDEADALFSKRLSTQSSNDMFANQQVAYLLQRIEDYNGVVILATNFKDNIDDAFLRRFQSIILFPKPTANVRHELWRKYFAPFDMEETDIESIATEYEITGGSIINVLRYCSIIAAQRGDNKVKENDILIGIKKEFLKEGITL